MKWQMKLKEWQWQEKRRREWQENKEQRDAPPPVK